MLGSVKIAATSGTNQPFVNPRAVIFDENKNYVLVLSQDRKIQVREIEVSRKTADKIYISKGAKAGDYIIASKQVFLFDSLKDQ